MQEQSNRNPKIYFKAIKKRDWSRKAENKQNQWRQKRKFIQEILRDKLWQRKETSKQYCSFWTGRLPPDFCIYKAPVDRKVWRTEQGSSDQTGLYHTNYQVTNSQQILFCSRTGWKNLS